jgi:cell surface protein SprA
LELRDSVLVLNDPSADDFQYFLGNDLDEQDAQLLQRYKNINGMENNTPIVDASDEIARSGSPYPDNEDINVDNTISESEKYYEYDINLEPGQFTQSVASTS